MKKLRRMRYKRLLLLGLVAWMGVKWSFGQDTNFGYGGTNWNNGGELAEQPSGWAYTHTPGFYFWLGASLAFVFLGYRTAWRRVHGIDSDQA